ncbi:ribosome biogenesis protein BMS1/TSR1, partial [Piptocephalis cylindrospora]
LGEEEEARQLQEYLKELKMRQREDKDDLEFPDEVDTPQDVSARVRFQRYRGLESFRQSPWDPYENLPMDYARIFQFENWSRTAARVLRNGKEEGLSIGIPITLHISRVPRQVVEEGIYVPTRPFLVFGLLQYENKMSLLNFTISRDTEFTESVRSKDPLVMQCGFRRYSVGPLYSQHTQRGGNNVHKFERFLRPGSVSVATIYGPVHFGRMATTFFRESPGAGEGSGLALVGTGKLLSVEPTRIVAKRIILTGYPFKVHTRSAVVRYMFFSREDIEWFKPVKVTTKFGKVGHIKEPLGTHGYMKVQFDGPIKQHDTICMNLYKRIFPKWNTSLWKASPLTLASSEDVAMEE